MGFDSESARAAGRRRWELAGGEPPEPRRPKPDVGQLLIWAIDVDQVGADAGDPVTIGHLVAMGGGSFERLWDAGLIGLST